MYKVYKILKLFSEKNLFLVLLFSIISNIFQTLLLLCIPLLSFFYLRKSFESEENFIPSKISELIEIEINFLTISHITLVIVIISTISNLIYLVLCSNISFETGKKIQMSAFKYFLFQPYSFFQKKNKNEIINKSIQDIIRIPNGIFIPFFNIFNSFILAIIIFLTLIILNPLVSISLTILLTLIYFILFQKIKSKLKKFSQKLTNIHKNLIEISNFIFGLNKDIKHYNKENYFLEKIQNNSQNYKKIRTFLNIISLSPRFIIEGIAIFLLVIFIIYSIKFNLFSQEIILEFLVILLFTIRIIPHIQLIFSQFSTIQSNLTVLEGINKYKKKHKFDNKKNLQFYDKIILGKIDFKYDKKIIFKNLNLKIHKGEKMAIIGPNGSGKTTLMNILSGFVNPDKGLIKIDNKKALNNIYNYFGTITSNPLLLNGSIYENICLSHNISKEVKSRINNILKHLGMTKLSKSYSFDKDVSQKLSQGEKQAIAIARFIFFKKQILIIDEGTSNLRIDLEKNLIKALNKINKELTIIFITHRYSNLSMFKKIYKIHNKKLKTYFITNKKN